MQLLRCYRNRKNPGQFYEAVLCITYAYLNQGFYQRAEKWLREIENQGREWGLELPIVRGLNASNETGRGVTVCRKCRDSGG